jgi:hypothetical protein
MNRRVFGVSALAAMILGGCGVLGTNFKPYRYRLTVEVDTPEGLKTGSTVIEVRWHMSGPNDPLAANASSGDYFGEAAVIDLGPHGTLFALPRSEDDTSWGKHVMADMAGDIISAQEAIELGKARRYDRQIAAIRRLWVLPRYFPKPTEWPSDPLRSGYPILVRFRDINNPKTVEKVDPEDFAASFGTGIKLRRITVALTDDPVTTGIEKRLGWLGKYPEPPLNPDHGPTDWSASATLTHGDFRKSNQ